MHARPDWRTIDSFVGNTTDPAAVAHRACPVCGERAAVPLLAFENFQFFTDDATRAKRVTIRNVRCTRCQAVYLDPVYTPRGFAALFAEAGRSYGATPGRALEQRQWLQEHQLLAPGSRLLDIGCYDGAFLAQLPDDIRRVGVDIDAPAVARGRARFADGSVEFVCGDLDAFALGGAVDTMVMFHVLEHLPDPVRTLRHLRTMAHHATRLVIEIPVVEHGFTNDINGFLSAQHLTHFSRRSLRNVLAQAGWYLEAEMQQPSYNGYRVIATPTDRAPHFIPEPEDEQLFERYLAHWHRVVRDVSQRIVQAPLGSEVVVWGGGLHTEFLYHTTPLFDETARRFLIVDSDPLKQGRSWRGISIVPPAVLSTIAWHDRTLLVSSYGGQQAIVAEAMALGVPEACIATLYDHFRLY